MKVFISWSGEPSRSIAREMASWLPKVLQSVETWMSDEDLQKGNQWTAQLTRELADTSYGLVILTRDNQAAPWLNFEAGALSKKVTDNARVTPVLIDLDPTDVVTPLKEFQAARLEREDWRKTLRQMNELSDKGLDSSAFDEVFDVWWERLNGAVERVLKAHTSASAPSETARTEREIMEETLELVRSLARQAGSAPATAARIAITLPYPADVQEMIRQVSRLDPAAVAAPDRDNGYVIFFPTLADPELENYSTLLSNLVDEQGSRMRFATRNYVLEHTDNGWSVEKFGGLGDPHPQARS